MAFHTAGCVLSLYAVKLLFYYCIVVGSSVFFFGYLLKNDVIVMRQGQVGPDVQMNGTELQAGDDTRLYAVVRGLLDTAPRDGTFMIKRWNEQLNNISNDILLRRHAENRHVVAAVCSQISPSQHYPSIQQRQLKGSQHRMSSVRLLGQPTPGPPLAPSPPELQTSAPLPAAHQWSLSSDELALHRLASQEKGLDQMFVNDNLGIIYCEIPKVACTQWKRIFIALTGKFNITSLDEIPDNQQVHTVLQAYHLKKLTSFTPGERLRRLKTYFKFMFVRDPLERLLSAHRDKFTETFRSWVHYPVISAQIAARYRPHTRRFVRQQRVPITGITFEEFIKYILDLGMENIRFKRGYSNFEIHWRPMHALCHPCMINYDFIGKYETLEEDANLLLKILMRNNGTMTFPKFNTNRARTGDLLASSLANLTKPDLQRLWSIYKEDYELFDYPDPNR